MNRKLEELISIEHAPIRGTHEDGVIFPIFNTSTSEFTL